MGVWVSYPNSVIRSEQLSYTKVLHPGNVYRYRELSTDGPKGGMSMFGTLEGGGRHTDSVSVFIIFF